MARTFDGADDEIRCDVGGCSLTGAFTIICVIRRNSNGANYHNLVTVHNSSLASTYGLEIENNSDGNQLQVQVGGTFVASTFTIMPADGWILTGAGKAVGTTTPRCHKYVYGTDTWTHQNAGGTAGNPATSAGGTVRFGEWEDVDDYDGDMAAAAIFDRNLSDVEVEQMAHSLLSWVMLAPVGMWVLDQQAVGTAVNDWTGNGANQSAITGTALAASSPLITYGHEPQVISRVTGGALTGNVGQITETNIAQPIGRLKTKAIGMVIDTQVSRPVTATKSRVLGQVTETDSARLFSITKGMGQVTETNLGRSVTASKIKTLGLTTATDVAQTVSRLKSRSLGQVTQTDTSRPIAHTKQRTIGQTTETDTAQTITRSGTVPPVNRVTETNISQAIGKLKTKTVGQITQTDVSRPVTRLKARAVGFVTGTDTARTFSSIKVKSVGQVVQTDLARTVSRSKLRSVGLNVETNTARTITRIGRIGQVLETDLAFVISYFSSTVLPTPDVVVRAYSGYIIYTSTPSLIVVRT